LIRLSETNVLQHAAEPDDQRVVDWAVIHSASRSRNPAHPAPERRVRSGRPAVWGRKSC